MRVEGTLDDEIEVDRVRIRQVLMNLLVNAAKFSDAGTPITLIADSDTSQVRLQVRDRGVGIDPTAIAQLFQPFVRLHQSNAPGSGLGLAISRALVEAHGGRIEAASAGPGQGATFTVTLPRAPQA